MHWFMRSCMCRCVYLFYIFTLAWHPKYLVLQIWCVWYNGARVEVPRDTNVYHGVISRNGHDRADRVPIISFHSLYSSTPFSSIPLLSIPPHHPYCLLTGSAAPRPSWCSRACRRGWRLACVSLWCIPNVVCLYHLSCSHTHSQFRTNLAFTKELPNITGWLPLGTLTLSTLYQ